MAFYLFRHDSLTNPQWYERFNTKIDVGGAIGIVTRQHKEYWKDKECFKCKKKGHPSPHCPDADDDDDEKSLSSQARSVKRLAKDMKRMKKSFVQLQQMKETESDISDSEESEGDSHSQFELVRNDINLQARRPRERRRLAPGPKGKGMHGNGLQFTQVERGFEPQIAKLLKQSQEQSHGSDDRMAPALLVRKDSNLAQAEGTRIKLDLREVILLDSQSTRDLFCNRALVVKKTFRQRWDQWFPKRQRWRAITHTWCCGTTKRPSPILWL
jgi:hypothetical protein